MFFVIFVNCVGPLYMAIKFFAFFFPTISTFGCFWSQWPTSLAVTSGREGVRTTSFKPWRPHRGSCRGATAIKENNGSRREQWLTSLTVWTVHSICTYMIFIYIYRYISLSIYRWAQRCGAGGCRREATWIQSWLFLASGIQCFFVINAIPPSTASCKKRPCGKFSCTAQKNSKHFSRI